MLTHSTDNIDEFKRDKLQPAGFFSCEAVICGIITSLHIRISNSIIGEFFEWGILCP